MNKKIIHTFFVVMFLTWFISLLPFSCHNTYAPDGPGGQPMDFSESSYLENYTHWNKKGLENYSFILTGEFNYGDSTSKTYEVQITVSGKSNSIKFSEESNISEGETEVITSIEKLFSTIKTVLTDTSSSYEPILLSYNKTYGYPEQFLYSNIQTDSKTATFEYVIKKFNPI